MGKIKDIGLRNEASIPCMPSKKEMKNNVKIAKRNLNIMIDAFNDGILEYDEAHKVIGKCFVRLNYAKQELSRVYPKKEK